MKSEITNLPKSKKIMVKLAAETDEEEINILATFMILNQSVTTNQTYVPSIRSLYIMIPYDTFPAVTRPS